jgi:hypothetical protein
MPATDIVAYDRAREALKIGPTDSSARTLLEAAITAVTHRIEDLCGAVVHRTVTEVVDVGWGSSLLRLNQRPVASITSVKQYRGGALATLTAETLTVAGGYLALPEQRVRTEAAAPLLSGVLQRRMSFSPMRWEQSRVEVVYTAGRYATTAAAAGSNFEQAALLTLKSLWRTYGPQVDVNAGEFAVPFQSFPGFAVPKAAVEFLAADMAPVVA